MFLDVHFLLCLLATEIHPNPIKHKAKKIYQKVQFIIEWMMDHVHVCCSTVGCTSEMKLE
jgi:hypothetical protein